MRGGPGRRGGLEKGGRSARGWAGGSFVPSPCAALEKRSRAINPAKPVLWRRCSTADRFL